MDYLNPPAECGDYSSPLTTQFPGYERTKSFRCAGGALTLAGKRLSHTVLC